MVFWVMLLVPEIFNPVAPALLLVAIFKAACAALPPLMFTVGLAVVPPLTVTFPVASPVMLTAPVSVMPLEPPPAVTVSAGAFVLPVIEELPVMTAPRFVVRALTVKAAAAFTALTVVLARTVAVLPVGLIKTFDWAPRWPIRMLLPLFFEVRVTSLSTASVNHKDAALLTPIRKSLPAPPLAIEISLESVAAELMNCAIGACAPAAVAVTVKIGVAPVEAPFNASTDPVPVFVKVFCVVALAPVTNRPVVVPAVLTVNDAPGLVAVSVVFKTDAIVLPLAFTANENGVPALPKRMLPLVLVVIATSFNTELVMKSPAVPTTPTVAMVVPLASVKELVSVAPALLAAIMPLWFEPDLPVNVRSEAAVPVAVMVVTGLVGEEPLTVTADVAVAPLLVIARAVPLPRLVKLFWVGVLVPDTTMPCAPTLLLVAMFREGLPALPPLMETVGFAVVPPLMVTLPVPSPVMLTAPTSVIPLDPPPATTFKAGLPALLPVI